MFMFIFTFYILSKSKTSLILNLCVIYLFVCILSVFWGSNNDLKDTFRFFFIFIKNVIHLVGILEELVF